MAGHIKLLKPDSWTATLTVLILEPVCYGVTGRPVVGRLCCCSLSCALNVKGCVKAGSTEAKF